MPVFDTVNHRLMMAKHMQMTMEMNDRLKNLEDQMARLLEQMEEWMDTEDTVSEYTLHDSDEDLQEEDAPMD